MQSQQLCITQIMAVRLGWFIVKLKLEGRKE